MEASFWIERWNQGQIGFHQNKYQEMLVKFFPTFHPSAGQKVLVPLCGKSKDMIWLHEQKLNVHGVELHEGAVKAFFEENGLAEVDKQSDEHFVHYKSQNMTVSCGDFFQLAASEKYDYVYDRASLVALPLQMRKQYAKVVTDALKPGGNYLLLVYEYDQSKMQGPPFSISDTEVYELFGKFFDIKKVDSQTPPESGPRLDELGRFVQNVFLMKKNL